MMIDRVGGVGPGYEPRKSDPVAKTAAGSNRADSVVISEEATRKAEGARIARLVQSTEDTERSERLKEIKERYAKGDSNLSDDVLNQIADRISGNFFG